MLRQQETRAHPEWATEESINLLRKNNYFLEDEDSRTMYLRVVNHLSNYLPDTMDKDLIADKWFKYIWNNWLCPSTPVLCNVGTDRGMPIACFGGKKEDSMTSIFDHVKETALLTKHGGGTSGSWDKVRGRGEPISKGGYSQGTIPFLKVLDSTIASSQQANIRRGAYAAYMPITHKDILEFITIREPVGDLNSKCTNVGFHHGVTIGDDFMIKLKEGNPYYRTVWAKLLKQRKKLGEPYLMFYDTVNRANSDCYKKRKLKVNASNLCSEICLFSDSDHTFVCCLSSLNLFKYDEWKDEPDFLYYTLLFMDCVMEDFITNASDIDGFENAVRYAKKFRSIGIGVLGFHSLLQSKLIPFISIKSRYLINEIGKKLKTELDEANIRLGVELGIPEGCDTTRCSHVTAIAPTSSNSIISGQMSPGIEPYNSNIFTQETSASTFISKNRFLEQLLIDKYPEMNNDDIWKQIAIDYQGSVQSLEFLTDEEKQVFLTAFEINQKELIINASIWQKYIDQGISLNLFFADSVDMKYFSEAHVLAWEVGLKSLYYVRSTSASKLFINQEGCTMCQS